jgi:antitoxin HicB
MAMRVGQKPLDYFLKLRYPVTLIPDETGGYAVEIEGLPGCFSQGETVEEALQMIDEARRLWLEVAYEDGYEIPLPHEEREYSGKFFIRAPKSLHRTLDILADREGVSLNQFLVATLSKAVGMSQAKGGLAPAPPRPGKKSA